MTTQGTNRSVCLVDTTLRDGEQAPGVVFDRDTKLVIARMLDQIGIDELEVGTPAMGEAVQKDIKALVREGLACRLTSWCRANKHDILFAQRCGTKAVHISFPTSDIHLQAIEKNRSWVFDHLETLMPMAKRSFDIVTVGAQDATRTDSEFLTAFARCAAQCGADRLRIADTVGIAAPWEIQRLIKNLKESVPLLPLEFHGHNDLGMAAANSLMAVEAGAQAVSVTVNGMGERSGNAAIEQVAVALQRLSARTTRIRLSHLTRLCRFVAQVSGRPIPAASPITGDVAFSHESGIHCAAMLKDDKTYQPFSPSVIGRKPMQFKIGSHSGSTVIRHVLSQSGIFIDRHQASILVEKVRQEARKKRTSLSKKELVRCYEATCR